VADRLGGDRPWKQCRTCKQAYQGEMSIAMARERCAVLIRHPEQHERRLDANQDLALALATNGRHSEAESMLRRVLAFRRRSNGAAHRSTLTTAVHLSRSLSAQFKFSEAGAMLREMLAISNQALGEGHAESLSVATDLASVAMYQGNHAEAFAVERDLLAIKKRVLGSQHASTLTSAANVAIYLRKIDESSRSKQELSDLNDQLQQSLVAHEALIQHAAAQAVAVTDAHLRISQLEEIAREREGTCRRLSAALSNAEAEAAKVASAANTPIKAGSHLLEDARANPERVPLPTGSHDELEHSRKKLADAQAEVANLRAQLSATQAEVATVRTQLASAQAEAIAMTAAVMPAAAGRSEPEPEALRAVRELSRAAPVVALSVATPQAETANRYLPNEERRPRGSFSSIHLKFGSRATVWSAAAFLEHRQRTRQTAHPLLCCHERDRKDYTCLLCSHFLVQPVMLNNGKGARGPCGDGPFCDACIREHLRQSPWCPACKQPTRSDQLVEDTRIERALRGVLVKCAYCLEGCEWRGEIRDFSAHQQSCPGISAVVD
jgi:hypothetical protein